MTEDRTIEFTLLNNGNIRIQCMHENGLFFGVGITLSRDEAVRFCSFMDDIVLKDTK